MQGDDALEVLGALSEALLVVDDHLAVHYANPAAHDLLGWPQGELVGCSVKDVFAEASLVADVIRDSPRPDEPSAAGWPANVDTTVVLLHRSGRELEASVRARPVALNGDGGAAITVRPTAGGAARPLAGVEHRLLQILAEDLAPDVLQHQILEVLGVELGWDAAGFWVVAGHRLRSDAQWTAPGFSGSRFAVASRDSEFARGEDLPGRVWADRAPAWTVDVTGDPGFSRRSVAAQVGLRTGVGFPLIDAGELLGVVDLFSRDGRDVDRAQLELFTTVGNELGRVIGRRLAEERVRAERERLQLATELANLGVWDWTPGRGVVASPNLADWLGFPEDPGRPVDDFMTKVPDDDRTVLLEAIEQVLDDGTEYHLVHRAWRPDGSVAWLEHRGRPRRDPAGRIVGITGVAMDITQRLEAEAEREGLLLRERAARAQVESMFDETRELAEVLQKSLLPRSLPRVPGVELAALYRAAAHQPSSVGGDFYDVFPLDGQHWGLVMGDVCGKGPEAAALTAQVRHTVRAAAMHNKRSDRVIADVDGALNYEELEGRFCSLVYGRLTPLVSGIDVRLANAGHLAPAIVRSSGRVERMEGSGGVVGIGGLGGWAEQRADLELGDSLVLYTDGIVDLRRGDGQSFGEDRLAWLLGRCAGLSASSAVHRIDEELRLFHPEARDDIAVLVVRAPGTRR